MKYIPVFLSVMATPIIYLKFALESQFIKLKREHWKLYKIIHLLSLHHNKRFPNLINPKTFNDKIQWLKLFDQDRLIIKCSDKLEVKKYIQDRLGVHYLPKVYFESKSPWDIDITKLPRSFVVKTNHDSGTVFLVQDKEKIDWHAICIKVEYSLSKTYGWLNGEWAYSMIEPKVFVEEYLGVPGEIPPSDFKFHCSNGNVLWLQYIYDRGVDTKEVIVSSSGEVMNVHFDHNMKHSTNFNKPNCFGQLKAVAEVLSKGFKYVRIDLYLINKRIFVGEITFYPLMGCYKGNGEKQLGKYLELNTKSIKSPIYMESELY